MVDLGGVGEGQVVSVASVSLHISISIVHDARRVRTALQRSPVRRRTLRPQLLSGPLQRLELRDGVLEESEAGGRWMDGDQMGLVS